MWPEVAEGYPDGPPTRAVRTGRPFAWLLAHAAWRIRVHGYEHVPRRGPVILAANHTGILDGPLLYAVVRRPVHALVKQEMFAGLLGRALRAGGQIPLDRFGYDVAAVKSSLAVLQRDDVLAIYPEGTRGAGDFGRTKPGAAYLALCTGAPIVPVAGLGVRGPAQSPGSLPRLRGPIDIVFGPAIDTVPIAWPRRKQVVAERAALVAEQLREHVRYACALTSRDLPRAPVSREPPPRLPAERSAGVRHPRAGYDPVGQNEHSS